MADCRHAHGCGRNSDVRDDERTTTVATDRPAMGSQPGLPGVASLTSDRLKAVSPTAATTAQARPKLRDVTPSCQALSNVTTHDSWSSRLTKEEALLSDRLRHSKPCICEGLEVH